MHPRVLKANANGIRAGHIVRHANFQFGCQPAGALPTSRVIVGLENMSAKPDDYNGCFCAARGTAPFLVTEVKPIEDCESGELEGFYADWTPGVVLVFATRLSMDEQMRETAIAERIMFVMGECESNLPLIESVDRIGTRHMGKTTVVNPGGVAELFRSNPVVS